MGIKHNIVASVILICSCRLQAQMAIPIPDSVSYQVINTFCASRKFERISKSPLRYVYEGEWSSETDTSIKISGAQHFLKRVKDCDTTKYFFDSLDYVFLESQISNPKLQVFQARKIQATNFKTARKTRIKNKQYFFPMTYAISTPIFSRDLKSAIIIANYWGMSRTYLYHLNPSTKAWEMVDQLWQDGS